MERHELSAVFPDMSKEEYQGLVGDIRERGLIEPCITYEGKVLDGWHRLQACKEVGVDVKTKELAAGRDPRSWVLSRNLHRRSLTKTQRVAIALKLTAWRMPGRLHAAEAQAVDATPVERDGPIPERPVTAKEIAAITGASIPLVTAVKRRIREGHGEKLATGESTLQRLLKRDGEERPLTPIERLKADNRRLLERIRELELALDQADPPASEEAVIKENRALHDRLASLTSQLEEARRSVAYWKERAGAG